MLARHEGQPCIYRPRAALIPHVHSQKYINLAGYHEVYKTFIAQMTFGLFYACLGCPPIVRTRYPAVVETGVRVPIRIPLWPQSGLGEPRREHEGNPESLCVIRKHLPEKQWPDMACLLDI